MYKVNLLHLKKGRIYYILPFAIGIIIFLCIYNPFFRGMVKKNLYDSVIKATSIDQNCTNESENVTKCAPIYYFDINGDSYVCKTVYSTEMNMDVFDRNVYYNSSNPRQCVTAYDASPPAIAYLLLMGPLFCFLIGLFIVIVQYKRTKIVRYLCKHGKLVKGLPYTIERTGIRVGNDEKMAPVVNYKAEDGSIYRLVGIARLIDMHDETIDLLVDDKDPKNYYYLEFNIKEKKRKK